MENICSNKSYYIYKKTPAIPVDSITNIGVGWDCGEGRKAVRRRIRASRFGPCKLGIIFPSGQRARESRDKPADNIRAITAGLSPFKMPFIAGRSLYFLNIYAKVKTIIAEGKMLPSVAIIAPGSPAIRIPTKVAELIKIGPGVISAIVTISANSVIVNQLFFSTT